MPPHKVRYALLNGLLGGAFFALSRYGVELNQPMFDLFSEVVGEKLAETNEVEYEWTDEEWAAMMAINARI